jgi:hypothetical protein
VIRAGVWMKLKTTRTAATTTTNHYYTPITIKEMEKKNKKNNFKNEKIWKNVNFWLKNFSKINYEF